MCRIQWYLTRIARCFAYVMAQYGITMPFFGRCCA